MRDALRPLVDRVAALSAALRGVPHFEWGTVASVGPVRVRLDGDEEPLAGSLSSLVGNLSVGVRVRVELQNRRATIVGRADNTEWVNISVPGATGTFRWRRLAGVIYVEFVVTFTSAVAAGVERANVVTLPSAARPELSRPLVVNTTWTSPAAGIVHPNGGVSLRNTSAASATAFFGSGSWPAMT